MRQAQASPRFLLAVLLIALVPLVAVIAIEPSWWTDLGARDIHASANDYAAINQGQLKNLAVKAYAHLQANLPNSTWTNAPGANLVVLISTFNTTSPYNYNVVNLGQLKTVAKPFYDVLNSVGYTNAAFATPYPWTGAASTNDFAIANIGQAKNLFSFDLSGFIPLSVKQRIVDADPDDAITTVDQVVLGGDFDGDGISDLQEYRQSSDPTDYYSQGTATITPFLQIVSGNLQTGEAGTLAEQPLIVHVTNGQYGSALPNAPVTFRVSQGNGQLTKTTLGTLSSSQTVRADSLTGQVSIYYQFSRNASDTQQITVTSGNAFPVVFTMSRAGGALTYIPDSGTYPTPQAITISCNVGNAIIHYTTNGNDPTENDPTIANGGFVTVDQSMTLKAKAWENGYPASDIKSADYVIQKAAIGTVSSGGDHLFFARVDGTEGGAGSNKWGELGDGTMTSRSTAVAITGVSQVKGVSASESHTLILTQDGSLYTAGNNYFGQLGNGTLTDQRVPQKITSLSQVIAVAAGEHHSLALTSDGSVWVFGLNAQGQLGLGSTQDQKVPIRIETLTNIVAIVAGKNFSLAMNSAGEVYAWGGNESGQLGLGSNTGQAIPVKIAGLSNVKAIAAGQSHAFAILPDGSVKGWGGNWFGQLGIGTNENQLIPVSISGLSNIVQIAAGAEHTLVLTGDGNVYAFGANWSGQLGTEFGTMPFTSTPMQVTGLLNVSKIAAGSDHSVALQGTSFIYVWGANAQGQLGLGSTQDQAVPQEVGGL